MMKKKIMHIVHHIGYGGAQRMFIDTTCGLQKRGATENVGCFVFDFQELKNRIHSDTRIIHLGLPRTDSYPFLALMGLYEFPLILWTVYKEKPDIIHVYYSPVEQFFGAIAGKMFGKKVVIRKYDQRAKQHVIFRFLNSITYPLCDRVVSIFSGGIDELKGLGVPSERIVYIPNGKEIHGGMGRKEAKMRLGLKETDFVIGAVSRIHPLKNYELAVEALPEILDYNENAKLVIVGDSPLSGYKEKLNLLIRKKGVEKNVIFLGERNDIDYIYPAFDIFVHPSFSEGGPGVVLEAMGAGLPIVATNRGGTMDVLKDCGVLVSPEDSKKFAYELKRLMGNARLREEYGKKAKWKVKNELSLDIMLEKYEKLFTSI